VPERYTETPLRPGPVLQNRHNIKLKEVLLAVWPLRWLIVGIFEVPYGKFISGGSKLFINWFLLYVPFFFLGYLIRQDNHNPKKSILWSIFIASIIVTFYGCYILAENSNLEHGLYFYGYLSVSVVPMSISLMYILKASGKPIINTSFTKKLSILTLGIYLVHPVILETINYIQYGAGSFHPIASVPVVTFIVFGMSAGIVYVIYKIPFIRRII
jgi:surface polysaccharide O-acyltransferase-like enzyme